MSSQELEGVKRTRTKVANERDNLRKHVTQLQKNLGILEEEGYIEGASLPAIVYDYVSNPRCEVHGATVAYDKGYYRCEACKTSVRLMVPKGKPDEQN